MAQYLFLGEEVDEEIKYEIMFLYEIGVSIGDIEYLLRIKSEYKSNSS